jgi:hypothetical protein
MTTLLISKVKVMSLKYLRSKMVVMKGVHCRHYHAKTKLLGMCIYLDLEGQLYIGILPTSDTDERVGVN